VDAVRGGAAGAVAVLLAVALAILNRSTDNVPLWTALIPFGALGLFLLSEELSRRRRPVLDPGPSFFRAAESTDQITVRVLNRGRRGTFYARLIDVQLLLANGEPIDAGPPPPWAVPWNPGKRWVEGPSGADEKRVLLRSQSDLLWIAWLEVWSDRIVTFSFHGVDHHQPYPVQNDQTIGPGVTAVNVVLRIWNEETGHSWAWNVRFVFSPDRRDPTVTIEASRER
jgi:hypothetical protein